MSSKLSLPNEPRANGFFVDGVWNSGSDYKRLDRVSPGHGAVVSSVTLCTAEDTDKAVAAARTAFEGFWSETPGAERGRILLKAAQGIRAQLDEMAYWETLETGKPISQSKAEIEAAADHYEAAAGMARLITGETHNAYGEGMIGLVTKQPIGVVGLITPWNFPFIVLAERLPFILAAGCCVVLKPSEMTSTTSLMFADILAEAGLPNGVYNVVTGVGPEVGEALSNHVDVDMISFTGSTAVGERVLEASKSNLKKVGLELGGKNPQIVFADANLDDAADGIVFGMCFNAGQCCVSGSRLIVEASAADALKAKILDKLSKVKLGDPLDPETQMGAIVSPQHFNKILGYVEKGTAEGANLEIGGTSAEVSGGEFILPTVFSGVEADMAVARDEIFGPVLSIMTFETADEAINMALDTEYGLAASVWSKNIDKAIGVIRKMRAGRCWVNTTIVGGPEQPMGGFKRSGTGRECGMMGVEEYMETKSIHVVLGDREHWVN
ncbi:aldehyde dehydrogenase family protein [Hoeflea poritis]|uniref:Aldehyde dehydrogenase family protein n=1 Tax=Hoeflea poritis TaxID=2993659 RepID=A0ABT4VPD2_9HYPH|nr:aldehyde dehydrogenase family protein [Hoeflea poritis]MDA4845873.1 aldehyde dehydrogenase family protein [Hoeflea poritis]